MHIWIDVKISVENETVLIEERTEVHIEKYL